MSAANPPRWSYIQRFGTFDVPEGLLKAMIEPAITPPIFVIEGDDIGVYDSLQAAEYDVEAPDVEEGIYEAFDALGRQLRLTSDKQHTRLSLMEEDESSPEVLEGKLRRFLSSLGDDDATDVGCDLPCLVGKAERYVVRPLTLRTFLSTLRQRIRRKRLA